MMMIRLTWLGCLIAGTCACGGGGGGNPPIIDGHASDGTMTCGVGDACNIVADTGCDDDQRCDVAEVNATCFEAMCVAPGSVQAGGACTLSNNEGAVTWDNCYLGLVCYQGACRVPCGTSTGACAATFSCVSDGDVGTLTLSVCVPS